MGRSELQKLFEKKTAAKEQVFRQCWPKISTDSLLLVVLAPEDEKQQKTLLELLQGLLVLPLQVIVISKTEAPDHINHPQGKISWVNPGTSGIENQKTEKFLFAADIALTFNESQATLKNLFEKGIVPIGLEKSPLLENYQPNDETGNSFTFTSYNPWAIFMSLVRACETHRFPYDWQHIIRGMLKVR